MLSEKRNHATQVDQTAAPINPLNGIEAQMFPLFLLILEKETTEINEQTLQIVTESLNALVIGGLVVIKNLSEKGSDPLLV
ncbi:hypothetical protein [Novipirellula artificiosorum]|uniref:Uncharacterized protein n=1 Tax=Novipirellula artificiosorum TaxID=2528016 RepID=A0A5C6D7V7_9BACT|nr:hypothetical protein [Novipirellula artificiosorum]TWU30969.1 hypothetical protein Poly41_64380 [Novipirellula artificiosorum]